MEAERTWCSRSTVCRFAVVQLLLMATLLTAPSAWAQDAAAQKTKIAIMNIRGLTGVDDELPQVAAQYLATRIAATERFTVITREDVKSMLQHEQLKMELGCDEEASCLAELGGALGVDLMITGTIALTGETVLVNLAMIDVNKALVVAREARRMPLADQQLGDATLAALDDMMPRLLPGEPVQQKTRMWTWVAAGASVVALGAGAGLMWFGNDRLTVAEEMAASGANVDFEEFDAANTQGQAGWYGGMVAIGMGVAAAAATVLLFFVEGE